MYCTADMIELAEAMGQCTFLDSEFHDWANLHDGVEAMTVNMIARSQIRMTPEFEQELATHYADNASQQLALARRLDGSDAHSSWLAKAELATA